MQNEILNIIARTVKKKQIVSYVSQSPFFTLTLDTTQDINKKD